jgi:hypothetical protein
MSTLHFLFLLNIVGYGNRLIVKNAVFRDVPPCGSSKNRQFGGTYRLHLQGEMNQRNKNNVGINWQLEHVAKPHGIASQKTAFFIVTAVETSNLT